MVILNILGVEMCLGGTAPHTPTMDLLYSILMLNGHFLQKSITD